MTLRDITDLPGCRAVVAVQEQVWGAGSEIVPASVLLVSAKRGGILIGAFDGNTLVGFVWSMPGVRGDVRTHWSHMLGVVAAARGQGLGERLKLAQRDRALAQGVDLIEWTFDPLQAPNAHLNLSVLGCTASTYLVDAYGEMTGPLHRGTPTDRLVAEWWIRTPPARRPTVMSAPSAIATKTVGGWTEVAGTDLALSGPRLLVPIPPRFTAMQEEQTALARAWRLAARDAFSAYFARGYRAVDFRMNRTDGSGAYVLESAG